MILLRDRRQEFEDAGVGVFGISRDSPWSHVAWREVLDLDFPLLSDFNGDAVRGFGVTQTYHGLVEAPARCAFLVDRDGIIRAAWRYATAQVPDFDELLGAARSLS
jgi:peroxiredoxin